MRNFKHLLIGISTGLMVTFLFGCVTRADIEDIKDTQKKILEKLDKGGPMRPSPQQARGPDASKVYAMPIENSVAKGPADAWVTLVEGSDFQCPFCSRAAATVKQVAEKYGKDLRIVFKHNPLGFHPNAGPAANAAECAGEQNKFWEMHDELFANQKDLSDAKYGEFAAKIGLNSGKFKKCFDEKKFDTKIKEDQKTLTQFGARGTPAFFINGRFLSGAQPQPAFEALIDEEMKKAKDSGVAKSDYYKKVVLEKGEKGPM